MAEGGGVQVDGAQMERTRLAGVRTSLAVLALDVLVLRHQFEEGSAVLQLMTGTVLLVTTTLGVVVLANGRTGSQAPGRRRLYLKARWHGVLSTQMLLSAGLCFWAVI